MRSILWALGFLAAVALGHGRCWSATGHFPYSARVAVDQIEVRCGPGWDYYVTAILKEGTTVEVYREDPGGWLAIRPPAGSYSWVAARHVSTTDQKDVIRVLTDGVVAWVGSSVTHASQHKWQVRLKQGELLVVLGKKQVSIGPGFAIETYYKVEPPAGEFRWIHTRYAQTPHAGNYQVAKSTIELADTQTIANKARDKHTTPTTPARQSPASTKKTNQVVWTDISAARQATVPKRLPPGDLQQELEQLNVDLGMLVSRPMQQWELDQLRLRSQQLITASKGTRWADEARELGRRVRDFEDLQRRYKKMLESDFSGVRDQRPGVSAAPRLLETDALEPDDSTSSQQQVDPVAAYEVYQPNDFDAEGWLVPVHSTKRIAPPFALLDDEGRVRCYVSPLPGLNLRRYQRKYVGLYGQRRYVKSLRAPHVTAERVVKEKHTRRTD